MVPDHGHRLERHALPVHAHQNCFNRSNAMSLQHSGFELPIAQDLPRQFDKIQRPEPFDEAFRLNFVDHHLPNAFKVAMAFTRKQEGLPSHFDGLYLEVSPPRDLVAKAVQIPMVLTAQGHGEFVTDLAPEGSWLCKFEVMGIAGSSTALALRRPTH
jgi:hypothetical protein